MDIRRNVWLAAMMLTFPMVFLNAQAKKTPPPDSIQITVRVYNYANIKSYRLERTKRRVSETFIDAGFEIHWIPCPSCEGEKSQYPDCMPDPGPTDLILNVMPRIDMEKNGFKKDAFGLNSGRNIWISTERLEEIAQDSRQPYDRILGLTVAHEMGHALLGSDSHSSRGIMRLRWNSKDLQLESRKSAGFTEEQIERMHRNWKAAQDSERPGGTARIARIPER